ncbi:MAG: HD domain-containing protein [Cyclobacteriaceae bacterium]
MDRDFITELLKPYQSVIGKHYLPYKNHVHRVLNLALAIHKDPTEEDKMKIAIAGVFHDIGLWTAGTFNYLDPSIEEATKHLQISGRDHWIEEIEMIINMHHKLSSYKGAFRQNVECFRQADLVDVSRGLVRFGVSKEMLKENLRMFPMAGFIRILVHMFFTNLIKNPLKPLPMLKK